MRLASDRAENETVAYVEVTTRGLIKFLDPAEGKRVSFRLHDRVDERCMELCSQPMLCFYRLGLGGRCASRGLIITATEVMQGRCNAMLTSKGSILTTRDPP